MTSFQISVIGTIKVKVIYMNIIRQWDARMSLSFKDIQLLYL